MSLLRCTMIDNGLILPINIAEIFGIIGKLKCFIRIAIFNLIHL